MVFLIYDALTDTIFLYNKLPFHSSLIWIIWNKIQAEMRLFLHV